MIHGREKSDSTVVETKPTNTAETIVHAQHDDGKAVEPVERRAGTKRNADEQSTLRAQDRNRVSQALGRTASRKAKEEGEVHCAPPPHQRRLPTDGVLRAQTRYRPRGGWTDVVDLRSRP